MGSRWRSARALRSHAEWNSDGRQRGNDARCRDALHSASPQPNVAGRYLENAATVLSGPGVARTVQHRRSGDALRGRSHHRDLPSRSSMRARLSAGALEATATVANAGFH